MIKFLGTHNLAFRGTNEKLFQSGNGKFLGLVEIVSAGYLHVLGEQWNRAPFL